jgi:phage-related protein
VLDVFEKKTSATPKHVVEVARNRWKKYLRDAEEG